MSESENKRISKWSKNSDENNRAEQFCLKLYMVKELEKKAFERLNAQPNKKQYLLDLILKDIKEN